MRLPVKKISESKKGKKLSEAHRAKVVNALIGRKHSDETKQKMSESHKGIKFSEEHNKHLSDNSARRGKPAPMVVKSLVLLHHLVPL